MIKYGLIIDTSGESAFVACARDEKIVQSMNLPQGRELSSKLFNYLASLGDVKFDYVSAGVGPGTFTGTRVGALIAQALAYGWKIPLIPFSSSLLPEMDAIAEQTYDSYLKGEHVEQIELVYISPTT